ncbi:MAG: murein biosynthesis integral membrane protein MurJ [Chloroflexota bacterium]|nr:murein biosynthesis integral membrane protein MurJ [Chloroflexota bacterium]
MTANDPARAPRQAWPTWPSPGIPTSPDDWRQATPRARSLVGSASVVALAFVLSRVLGMAREIILAYRFGTSSELAAYVAAFRVPDLLFLVLISGAFGSAFIPVFAGLLGRDREEDAWRLASVVLNYSALALVTFGAFAFVFARPLVRFLVAPGYAPADQELTVDLMRLLLLSPLFLGLGIAAKGILEAQDKFTLPALAPVVYNAAIILGALFLVPAFGVRGVAIGVVAGALGHVLVQVPGLLAAGLRYRLTLDRRVPGLADVARLLGPRLVGQAAFQINFIAVTAFATRDGPAEVAAFNYAWQLLMLPHGVVALSISTVVFPTMSRLFDRGDTAGLRSTFGRAMRPLLFLSLPAAVGLFFFRESIVQTIFQWGAFGQGSTALVVPALAWFAAGLVAYAAAEVLTRAFYAMHDTRTPVVVGVATILLNVALAAALVGRFGYVVLAFGLSLTTALEAIVLLAILRRRLGGGAGDARWIAKATAATAAMAVVAAVVAPILADATEPGIAPRVVQIALFAYGLGLTGATYAVAAYLLRIPEATETLAKLGARLPRTPGLPFRGRAAR